MLVLKDVRKVYRTRYIETRALDGISLEIRAGEFVSITGASGSGKTTLLHILGLLDELDEGSYTVAGQDVRNLSDAQRSALRNQYFGFVFQAFNLIGHLDALANTALPLTYRRTISRRERLRRAAAALERVGLATRMRHLPAQLSGGQQQRVAIARALVGNPKVLLADEPTGNLDTEMRQGVLELLQSIHRDGTAVVLVTHDPVLAAAAPRSIQLMDGKIINSPRYAREVHR